LLRGTSSNASAGQQAQDHAPLWARPALVHIAAFYTAPSPRQPLGSSLSLPTTRASPRKPAPAQTLSRRLEAVKRVRWDAIDAVLRHRRAGRGRQRHNDGPRTSWKLGGSLQRPAGGAKPLTSSRRKNAASSPPVPVRPRPRQFRGSSYRGRCSKLRFVLPRCFPANISARRHAKSPIKKYNRII